MDLTKIALSQEAGPSDLAQWPNADCSKGSTLAAQRLTLFLNTPRPLAPRVGYPSVRFAMPITVFQNLHRNSQGFYAQRGNWRLLIL